MSIPNSFNPMGTLGEKDWEEVDMSTFKNDNWNDLAAMTPPGLVPCGVPLGGISVRKCTRSRLMGMLFFGYDYENTTTQAVISYYNKSVPPRNHLGIAGAPALEFWNLGLPVATKLEFTLSVYPTKAFAARNDWEDSTDYEEIQIVEKEAGVYECESTYPARSIIITCPTDRITGKITKIYTKG